MWYRQSGKKGKNGMHLKQECGKFSGKTAQKVIAELTGEDEIENIGHQTGCTDLGDISIDS